LLVTTKFGDTAATIAAGLLSGGAAWVIGLEVFLELAVGVPVSIRELEKGENISAAFSFLTAIIPIFKLSRSLRGITDAEFDSLSNSIIRSNLTRNSSGKEFETWMKGLNETDQKTLRKILEYDDKTKKEIVDQVTLFAQEQGQIFKELSKSLKANKNILKDVGFFQKLWAKELTANGVVAIIALSLKMCCEEELDSSEKEKLKGFYNRIPDSLKKEVAYNLFQNSPEIKKILPLLNNVTTLMDSAKIVDNSKKCEWLNTELKKEFTKEGLDYIELGDDSTRAKPQENISSETINNLRNNGWVPKNELGDKEFFDVKFIGDGWYLVK